MYPNLYYAINDWFGWKINALKIFYTFGIFVALGFIAGAYFLTLELKRKEKQGLLQPREETITAGKPASFFDLFINGLVGFIFGYKLIGAFIASRSHSIDIQDYIFSSGGSWGGGLVLAAILIYFKYREKNKQKLATPEKRIIRIWPHDRVGDIVIFALIFGIIGAKLFDNLENWDRFIQNPIGNLISPSGLTFYGGLIFAATAICIYAYKKGINILHLTDAAAPALMIAYAIGRIGCQVAGDGDWGIYNSAYISDVPGHVVASTPQQFNEKLGENATYFLSGSVTDSVGVTMNVTDRHSESLEKVPHKSFKGPDFLPTWMFAFTYPHNVNEDGILLKNCEGKYCRALPQPVFPTPFYETIACTLLFLFLWLIRRRIKIPGIMFCIYLIVNGVERFFVETIRVNTTYSIFGIHPTQAELISASLVITGLIGIAVLRKRYVPKPGSI
ncbi:prolipoprotein diacylglyceryl transferase [Ginsengibacter hankyongi]|uniref:Prolipoprotein diacylglyceryl transferase n=1 Tax=Ginsengibacter hankyongi TaxID=2607284 RepID=A0A5J5IE45_9BACT|nr:prolipoprotein diacylglyceryl transferase family protein [Ginsengibacter hankyongi]KAA9037301.1 prolipoprotein diacylglyceryl transferase [Ginsengibacter hankyongi]